MKSLEGKSCWRYDLSSSQSSAFLSEFFLNDRFLLIGVKLLFHRVGLLQSFWMFVNLLKR
jgi:hypothetical protein